MCQEPLQLGYAYEEWTYSQRMKTVTARQMIQNYSIGPQHWSDCFLRKTKASWQKV